MNTIIRDCWRRENRFWTVAWGCLVAVLGLFFFCNVYYDLIATYLAGYGFWEAIVEGDVLQSYTHGCAVLAQSGDSTLGNMNPVYNYLVYVPFMIWSIPIWIIKKIFDINLCCEAVILWYKLLLVIVSIGCLLIIRGLLQKGNKERVNLALFLFVSSFLFVLTTLDMSQYDIIAVFFLLWAIDEIITKKKVTVKYILIFAIGTACKGFPIFLLIPVTLLFEKKVLKNIGVIIAGIIPTILNPIVFQYDSQFTKYSSANISWLNNLIGTTFPGGTDSIPTFIVIWILICIWSYMQSYDEEKNLYVIAGEGVAVYGLFLSTVFSHPQWSVLIVPFLSLVIALNEGKEYINLILEFGATFSLAFFNVLRYSNVYWNNFSMQFLLTRRLGIVNYHWMSFADYWYKFFGTDLNKVFYGMFVACIIAILYINYSKRYTGKTFNDKATRTYAIFKVLFLLGFWLVDFAFNHIYFGERIERYFG